MDMSFDDVFERMRRRVRELIEEIEEEVESMRSMWRPDGAIEPLYSMQEYPDHYEIFIDLPYSDFDSLSVEIRGNKLIIGCGLRDELEFSTWYTYRGVKFRKYHAEIRLPSDIDHSRIKIEKDLARKLIKIILPKKR